MVSLNKAASSMESLYPRGCPETATVLRYEMNSTGHDNEALRSCRNGCPFSEPLKYDVRYRIRANKIIWVLWEIKKLRPGPRMCKTLFLFLFVLLFVL